MKFYVGLHQPSDAGHFHRAFLSINRVRDRKCPVQAREWILDSGAFSELQHFGGYRHSPNVYAAAVNMVASRNPTLIMAVSQDYMCEPDMLARTGLTVEQHQRMTVERYDALLPLVNITLMPVLQGYSLESYLVHVAQYGSRLQPGMVVGVGSVCKRNGDPVQIARILMAIKRMRPGIRLHGFGLKITALTSGMIRACLHSADSMAWSFSARKQGRNQNSWVEAANFVRKIDEMPVDQWG